MFTELMILLMMLGGFCGLLVAVPTILAIALKLSGCELTIREIFDRL